MPDLPSISVVMSVYNGAETIAHSIDSILLQEKVNFELIIVNDGSNDETSKILAKYVMRDCRVRVIEQKNSGLTRALIRGCQDARGEYIARQDCGDISLRMRLKKQFDLLKTHTNIALVSCWTSYIAPADEELYLITRNDTPETATALLRSGSVKKIKGVSHHGSTMFRRSEYIRSGGYREQFYFAQDLDLWLRLTEMGLLAFVPEVLYQARFGTHDISGKYHNEQQALTAIMIEAQKARQRGENESSYLIQAAKIRPDGRVSTKLQQSSGCYFIGKCLLKRGDIRGLKYLKQALRIYPLHWRALVSLLLGRLRH